MCLVFELDSEIEEVRFNWDFQFDVPFSTIQGGMWSLILHMSDEEWADMRMPSKDIPK